MASGTMLPSLPGVKDKEMHPCHEAVASRKAYAENFVLFEKTSNSMMPVPTANR